MPEFYTYVFLNTLKPGNYTYSYDNFCISFPFEPFYVGKGCKDRINSHLKEIEEDMYNPHKFYTIQKIKKETGKEPISIKIESNINETCSFCYEKNLISIIGRDDLNLGPLTNLTDGGEGCTNRIWSQESRDKISKCQTGMVRKLEVIKQREETRKKNAIDRGYWLTEESKRKIGYKHKNKIVFDTQKEKQRESMKDRIGISKNTINKTIKLDKLPLYLLEGWKIGHCDKVQKIYVTSNKTSNKNRIGIYNLELIQEKKIKCGELGNYIKKDWLLGRLPSVRAKITGRIKKNV